MANLQLWWFANTPNKAGEFLAAENSPAASHTTRKTRFAKLAIE